MWQTERAQALGLQIVGTGELLTSVLSHLDQRTLLCSAVRVCRRWNHTIETASEIQHRHFLSPVPQADPSRPSPLDWDKDDGYEEDLRVRLNPLLSHVFRRFFTPSNTPSHTSFSSVFASPPDWNKGARAPADLTPESRARFGRLLRPDARWRRMLTQQPPVRRLGVWVHRQGHSRPPPPPSAAAAADQPAGTVMTATTSNGHFYVVEYPAGLRMGELYDLCLGPPGTPNLSSRPFWRPQTPGVWRPPAGGGGAGRRLGRKRCGAQEKALVHVLESAALQLGGPAVGEVAAHQGWQGVDGVLRLYKSNTSWVAADNTLHLDFMEQFRFPEAEVEAEAEAAA